jgi:hypothetical protein
MTNITDGILLATSQGVRIRLLIQPKASKTELIGPHNGALKIRLRAPPIEGRANEELVEFLADLFDLPKRSVEILRGETGRTKTVEIRGVSLEQTRKILNLSEG